MNIKKLIKQAIDTKAFISEIFLKNGVSFHICFNNRHTSYYIKLSDENAHMDMPSILKALSYYDMYKEVVNHLINVKPKHFAFIFNEFFYYHEIDINALNKIFSQCGGIDRLQQVY